MSVPEELSLLQDVAQVLNAMLHKQLIGPDSDNVLLLDIANLSDHFPVTPLQRFEVWLCQWPSLTGMAHCPSHTRAVHAATCLEREVAGRELVAASLTSSRQFSDVL